MLCRYVVSFLCVGGEGSKDAVVWAFRVCVCVMQNE